MATQRPKVGGRTGQDREARKFEQRASVIQARLVAGSGSQPAALKPSWTFSVDETA